MWNRRTVSRPPPAPDGGVPGVPETWGWAAPGDRASTRQFHTESGLRQLFSGIWRAVAWVARPFLRRYGILRRFRWQLVPFGVLAVIAGVGAVVARTAAGAGFIVIGGVVACPAAWLFTRWWLDEPTERVYATYVLLAASLWTAGVARYGWDQRVAVPVLSMLHVPPMRVGAWLLAVGVPSGIPWWWRFRHRGPGEIPDDTDDDDDADADAGETVPLIIAEWNTYLAAPERRFEGTRLINPQKVTDGETAEIVLVRGLQKTSDVLMNAELIASAYDRPDTQVLVEPHPQGRKSRAKLTLLDRDVLADVRMWGGSTLDPETGIQEVGTFPDHARAHWRWWIPEDGAVMSFVAGATRTGKSAFLKLLMASITDPNHPVPVAVCFADCEDDGQSLTRWKPKLKRVASGKLRTLLQLYALERITLQRSRVFSARGWDSFTPTDEFPLIAAVLDEIPALLKDKQLRGETIRILEMLAQRGAKRGIALVLVSQMASLEEIVSQTLRSMLRSGNVMCFRTGDSITGGMLGLQLDPGFLPEYFANGDPTKGLAVIKSCDGRQAPIRTDFTGDTSRELEIIAAAAETPLEAEAQGLYEQIMATSDDRILVYLGLESPPTGGEDAASVPDAGDRQEEISGVANAVLNVLADGRLRSRTEVAIAVRPVTTSVSTVGYALNKLKTAGLITQPGGDRTPYTITDAGRDRVQASA